MKVQLDSAHNHMSPERRGGLEV